MIYFLSLRHKTQNEAIKIHLRAYFNFGSDKTLEIELEAAKTAEMSVIGAIIIDSKSLAEVIDTLLPEYFYFESFKVCYEAILRLSSKGKPIDFVTVLNEVTAHENLIETDIKKLLLTCAESVPSISNISQYFKIIINSYKARKLKEIGAKIAFETTLDCAEEVTSQAMTELYEIMKSQKVRKLQPVGEVGLKLFETYISDKPPPENRCDTGFKRVDEKLKGMTAGNLIVLAARPKIGKTAFAMAIAENVARTGKTVCFFSQEMESTEVYERILAKNSNIPMNTLIDQKFKDKTRPESARNSELLAISKAIDDIYNLPLKINDTPSLTVNDIRLECRMVQKLGLIVIDYLQLMRGSKKCENRNQEVGGICRDLKCLAGELQVPILCLSQLNRVSDENKRPSPTDLRDSGEIEQSCNKLILMWCVEKNLDERGVLQSKTVGVDVALNRRGNTGVTLFNFNGNYMKFTELDRVYDEKQKENKTNWRR